MRITPRRPIDQSSGFSLIEILIVLLILAVGLVALAKFQGTMTQAGTHAKARTEAVNFSQDKLEDLRTYDSQTGYDDIGGGGDTIGPPGATVDGNQVDQGIAGLNMTYKRRWQVVDNAHSKTVAVEVSWPNSDGTYFGRDNSVELATTIAWIDPHRAAL